MSSGLDEAGGDLLAAADAGASAARGGLIRAAGYLVGLLCTGGSSALVFRHLGKTDSGLYVTATAWVAIIAAFSDLGMTGVALRELAILGPERRERLIRELLGLRLTLTVVGGTIVTAIVWLAYGSRIGTGTGAAMIGLLFQVTQDNQTLPLLVELRLGATALLQLARQVLTMLGLIALVLASSGLFPFLGVPVPVGLVVLALTVFMVRRPGLLAPIFDVAAWRRFVAPMLPYTLAITASGLYLRVAVLLVSGLCTAAQLGDYSIGYKLADALSVLPALVVGSLLPVFAHAAHNDQTRLGYALGRMNHACVVIGAWIAVSVAVGAPLGVAVLGGHAYTGATPILQAQGAALGISFVGAVWQNGLLSLGRYRQILGINLAGLVLQLGLAAGLIELWGPIGAAVSTGIVEICLALAAAAAVVRGGTPADLSTGVLWRMVPAILGGLAPLALTPLGVPVIIRVALSTLLFGVLALATGALPEELVAGARGMLARTSLP